MQVDEDDAAIESANHERLPQETNAVDNSGFAVWCKDNGLSDQVVLTLLDAGFRTPKDLTERKDDLKGLVLAGKLSLDDLIILSGASAIERMRNASASNSVDNAAFGLTTKDKQQPSAARDDAGQLNEQIKEAFVTYGLVNTLEWQRKNLRPLQMLQRPLPYVNNHFQFLASTLYIGDVYTDLRDAVDENFESRKQDRHPTAMVQAFGCGKTRAALELTNDYIVLPLELLPKRNRLVASLIAAQEKLKADLDVELKKLKQEDCLRHIEKFSKQCLRLVHLVLFSLSALLKHLKEQGLVKPSMSNQRHVLAVLLACDTKPLMDWLVAYFERDAKRILEINQIEFEREISQHARCQFLPKNLIFVLDEAHGVFECCQAFCLHEELSGDVAKQWYHDNELMRREKANASVTNLYYQFRRIIREYLDQDDNRIGFVMCSTAFKIWNRILRAQSPRGETMRFWQLLWFGIDNIKNYIQQFFNVPDELFTEDRRLLLTEFRRPSFTAVLLKALAKKSLTEINIQKWLDDSIQAARTKVATVLMEQMSRLTNPSNVLLVGDYSARRLVFLVYTMDKLCGGKLVLGDDILTELVDCGVTRISVIRGTDVNQVVCDDPCFIRELDTKVTKWLSEKKDDRDPVIEELLSPVVVNVCNNQSAKGFAAERILAWLALRDGVQVIAANDQQIVFRPGVALSCRSGTADQLRDLLQQHGTAADFIWRVMVERERRYVLFPKNHCGPDLIFRHKNGDECVIVVQCKMHSKGGPFALAKFEHALKTLNPAEYFAKRKKKDMDDERDERKEEVKRETQRMQWMTHEQEFAQLKLQRILFVALGFRPAVQYLVREYNASQQLRGSANFIYLMNLYDLKKQIDSQNYACLEKSLRDKFRQVEVEEQVHVVLQSEWLARDKAEDARTDAEYLDYLKNLCKQRNITLTKDGVYKTKEELISELDKYNVKDKLAELKWDLP